MPRDRCVFFFKGAFKLRRRRSEIIFALVIIVIVMLINFSFFSRHVHNILCNLDLFILIKNIKYYIKIMFLQILIFKIKSVFELFLDFVFFQPITKILIY